MECQKRVYARLATRNERFEEAQSHAIRGGVVAWRDPGLCKERVNGRALCSKGATAYTGRNFANCSSVVRLRYLR